MKRIEVLQKFRSILTSKNLGCYIIPSEDAHASEYVSDCDKRRAFLSGFTGSAGTALVTPSGAFLWTDGRYFLQAEQQLDSNWKLMKAFTKDVPTLADFLVAEKLDKIGFDPCTMSFSQYSGLQELLSSNDKSLVSVEENLVDLVWEDRPARPLPDQMFYLSDSETGCSWRDKVKKVRNSMKEKSASLLILTSLDDIAWLFNFRALGVIPYSPVTFAYTIITDTSVELFTDLSATHLNKFQSHLGDKGVFSIKPYSTFNAALQEAVATTTGRVWLDVNCNAAIGLIVPKRRHFFSNSPVALLKAVKTPQELSGMKRAHVLDAVALCEYLYWLEQEVVVHKRCVTELSGSDYLDSLRAKMDTFVGLSFESISGTGPHGAIIHYRVTPETDSVINKGDIYLIDSGGHYRGGTTDVTRTVHLGTPTSEQRDHYTRVLKGVIALSRTVFPEDIRGSRLDCLARHSLWQAGLEYQHGTGHGVGSFLNVHEGPYGISGARLNANEMNMRAGMVVTIEPGFYLSGHYGMRIENVVSVEPAQKGFDNIQFLKFKNLTLVPIQVKMVNRALLAQEDIDWLNGYHFEVRSVIAPELLKMQKQQVCDWLLRETEPI